MTRRFARELALKTLYSVEVGRHDPASALAQTVGEGDDAANQRAFIKELVFGTLEHAEQTDAVIAPLLEGWTLDRLPTVDRIVLRMSVYELNHHPQTPRAVVINEALELVKKFSTDDSGRFVNGVLAHAAEPVA
ncbi:MAG: transcription antitermination factor NusB [Candidatus Eremiobacteraeota bacterium]|nr:transcription antitermination factor NusB [Candidatus Eremiobacteraeota bacterium]MBC5802003.1 transcription antitermination factor NusB [Candidatus Eremiobacteraeota bacterium]MBC5820393.1 transcription antitermination factor NusB [Candidatus Eremiobacteraeota bacterium]